MQDRKISRIFLSMMQEMMCPPEWESGVFTYRDGMMEEGGDVLIDFSAITLKEMVNEETGDLYEDVIRGIQMMDSRIKRVYLSRSHEKVCIEWEKCRKKKNKCLERSFYRHTCARRKEKR
jgi:NTP pyrophosphatase (non-canonical NTP hydrolase)